MTANKTVSVTHTVKNGRYQLIVSWYELNDSKKKRKQKWISTGLKVEENNRRQLKELKKATQRDWEEKLSLFDYDLLFSDYLKSWLEDIKYSISDNTYFSYKNTINNTICLYFESKRVLLSELKPFHIQEFYKLKMEVDGVSANTIHHYHANIHKALDYAVKTERIKTNPADKIELPKKQKHIANFYDEQKLKALLDYVAGSNLETVTYLAAWFGLRRGEIIGLKWNSVDFEKKILTIKGTVTDKGESGSRIKNLKYVPCAKTSSSIRSFPLTDFQVDYLKKICSEQQKRKIRKGYNHKWDEFVCVRNNGDLIPLDYVTRTFPQMCLKAGLPRLTLHELRHTNISLLLEHGAFMKELQEWAGHSTYQTTANIYSHLQTQSKYKLSTTIEQLVS